MTMLRAGSVAALSLAVGIGAVTTVAQSQSGAAAAHVAAAKGAAGDDFAGVFTRVCSAVVPSLAPAPAQPAAPRPAGPPERSTWHAEPVKVFDNLYFVGQTEYSAWAVTTSAGILLIYTIFDYSGGDESVGGVEKPRPHPAPIKDADRGQRHRD